MDVVCKPKNYREWKCVKDICNELNNCNVFYDIDENERSYHYFPYLSAEFRSVNDVYVQGYSCIPNKLVSITEFINTIKGVKDIKPITMCIPHILNNIE